MRFLVDECTGPAVAAWLRSQSHEVFSVFDEARRLLITYADRLPGAYVVVTETQIRFSSS